MQHVRCDSKHTTWLSLLLALGLVVALGSSITAGPYCVWAQEMGPLANPVGTGFTYQGRLIRNDTPVDGVTCTFTFDLYGVASGGTPLDTDSVSAPVSDGYFSVALDFGSDAFTGEARWLQVAVQCPGDSSLVPLDDQRIVLSGAPYSHSLRPGSMLHGSATGPYPGQGTFNVQNEDLSVGRAAVFAISGSGLAGYPSKAVGIRGEAADGFGIAGRSATSVGVYGSSISHYGVWGNSADDTGVMGTSSGGYGVYARGGSGDLSLYNGTLNSTLLPESDLTLRTNDYVDVHLDDDGGSKSQFRILNDSDTVVF